MDKNPKKPDDLQDEDGQQGMMRTNIPLTIAVSAFINSKDWFDWILHAAETLVIFYLTYQIVIRGTGHYSSSCVLYQQCN